MPEIRTVKGFSEDGLPLAEGDFECCTFDHSDNSPCFSLLRHARLHIATCIIPNISILVNKNKHQIINFLYVLK